jgi:hypothetical protein
MKHTIEINLLNELFEYKDGFLYRKITRSSRAIKGEIAGRLHPNGYRYVSINKKKYLEHRIIFALHYNFFPETVDHIDLNKSNNKIKNLRAATHQENCYNRPIRKDNSSGVAGVNWSKVYKKWVVRITVNGKRKFLGRFSDLQVAKTIAEATRIELHKEFAYI